MSEDKDLVEGVCIGHVGCPIHGSSDSLALYKKTIDGKEVIDGLCWSICGFVGTEQLIEHDILDENGKLIAGFVSTSSGQPFVMTDDIKHRVENITNNYEVCGWAERKIPKVVSEFYGVRTKKIKITGDEGNEKLKIGYRFYPSTKSGEIVGYHVRDEEVKAAKNRGEKLKNSDGKVKQPFFPIGDVRSDCELFGQSLFPSGSKYLVLASGEEDVQAIFTALNTEVKGGKVVFKKYINPIVSVTVGESALKQIRNNYDYITSFENVVIMYDNDKAGKAGAEKIAKILPSGLAKIASYRRNDACAHSSKGEFQEIVSAFWNAEQFSPVDVLHLNQLWSDFEDDDANVKIPFPPAWKTLNEMMGGGRERGEVTVIGGLTSIGKSSYINNIVYHLVDATHYKVGVMYLEGTKREVVRDLLSLDLSMNLRKVDRSKVDMNYLKRRFNENLVNKDQFIYVDHQGSMNNEIIFEKLNYLAKVEGCDTIIIDPLQACVNSNDNGKIIDFMDTILKFAKETDTDIIIVSHMKKPQGDNPHDVSEYDLMGSSSINQIAFNTILISRDKMSNDSDIKNSTHVKLVKCRRTGETGDAGWLRYDDETTHIYPTFDPYERLELVELGDFSDEFVENGVIETSTDVSTGGDEYY